jgi:outer membrane protein assembly factor BamB
VSAWGRLPGEPPLRWARLTSVADRFWGDALVWRAALVVSVVCLTAVACSPPQPLPGPGVFGISCVAVAHRAWAIRVTAGGRVVWRAPVRGWTDRAPSLEEAPDMPVSPLVAGSVVVVADGDAATGLHLPDGRLLWRWAGTEWVDGMWPWRGLVVVLTGGRSPRARLTGLVAATGAVRWARWLPGGVYGTPVATADGGLAVARGSGGLEVVSLAGGTIRWARPSGLAGPLAAAGGLVLAAAATGVPRLTGYDDRTGARRWTFGRLPVNPSLTVVTGQAVATWLFPTPRGTSALAVIDAATGRVRWQFDMGRSVRDPALLTARDARGRPAVLATDALPGRLWLISLRGGHQQWTAPAPLVAGSAPLMAGPDIVTFQAPHANDVTFGTPPNTAGQSLVSADAATGALRWAHRIPQSVTSPAVLAGRNIVVMDSRPPAAGSPNVLLAYRAATGQPAWRLNLPAAAVALPVPAAGGLLAQAGHDTAFCAMPP